jgi:hypothetical protein
MGQVLVTGPDGTKSCQMQPNACEQLNCESMPVPAAWAQCVNSLKKIQQGEATCTCVPDALKPGYVLFAGGCQAEVDCQQQFGPSYRQEGGACIPCDDCPCNVAADSPACIPVRCEDYPDLRAQQMNNPGRLLCIEAPPPPGESCTEGCHEGIEDPHPWFSGPNLTCSGCHGGNPTATTRETAHIAIPPEWQAGSTQWGRPNLRYYWNWNTLFGVENFTGGLEWLRFRNPGDLRVASQSCGKEAACHQSRVENLKRGSMATEVGLTGVAIARDAVARSIVRGGDGIYKWDTTEGMTLGLGELQALKYDPSMVGSVQRINKFQYTNREFNGAYTEVDFLKEIYDKQCGDCHLGNAGANNRYADFRSSGCSACHMSYALDGRSRSNDQMIRKDEPTYPSAWAQIANFNANDLQNLNNAWLGPERSHPTYHRLTKVIASQRCGACHVGSNRTDWQYRGYQFDPNRDAVTALNNARLNANQVTFTDEIDNNADANARYHGAAQNQILKYVDYNNDGLDDSPADVHFLAGLECIDCHTTGEMHNEIKLVKVAQVTDWNDRNQVVDMSGALWSHMDQATEVECVHCHGNLEYRALPNQIDNRNPVKNFIVCPEQGEVIPNYTPPAECSQAGAGGQGLTRGRWLKSKMTGRWHYLPQTLDTVQNVGTGTGGGATRPNGSPIYTLNASMFHGRFDGPNLANGAGPCPNGNTAVCFQDQVNNAGQQVTQGFSHLGLPARDPVDQHAGGLECFACHSTWVYACFGCHLTLRDFNGNNIERDFSRATGEYTYGVIAQADFTYIDSLAIQLGINSEGKISQFLPETKQGVRHIDAAGNDYFGTKVIVNNDANLVYNVYRHRSGYGLRQYATEVVGLPLNSDGLAYEQDARMDQNAGEGYNQMMPHSVQRSHPRMDCEFCHLNANDANAAAVQARYGVNPNGFANVSAYLAVLNGLNIVRNNTNQAVAVNAAAGFRFDANIDPDGFTVNRQTDYVVFNDGYPLSYSNHPMVTGRPGLSFDPFYQRAYPRLAQVSGPLNQALLTKMVGGTVRVANTGVQFRANR